MLGNLTIGNSGTLSLSDAVGGDLVLKGNWTRNGSGAFNPKNRAVYFNAASGNQTIAGTTTFDYLILDKAAGNLVLGNDITLNQTLTLSNGLINTGANKVIITSTGSIARTNGWVFGNLQKYIPTGAASPTFEIGDASVYAPVSLAFGSVGTAGNILASTLKPNVAPAAGTPPAGSGISQTKYLDRKWTLTNTGTVFDNYSATFTFVAGDIIGGANTASFIVGKKDGTTWTNPTIGTKTSTSTQITGATSFSEFSIGEMACVNVGLTSATATASPICPSATTTMTASGLTGTNAVVNWWTGTGGTGTNVGTGLTSNPVGPGTYYAYATGDCGSPVQIQVVVGAKVDVGLTSATATATPICSNATTTLTYSGLTGTNALVTWTQNADGTGLTYGTGTPSSPVGPGTYYAYALCVSLKTPPRRKYYLDKIELIYEGWNFSGTTFSISIKQSFH
ncbi:MAG: hypothetical protein IPH57_06635 [Saprospiraceae bacterium]|nr:hypothetical protein [Saprospiraceae bacterium]